jgi:hypothetical protein
MIDLMISIDPTSGFQPRFIARWHPLTPAITPFLEAAVTARHPPACRLA